MVLSHCVFCKPGWGVCLRYGLEEGALVKASCLGPLPGAAAAGTPYEEAGVVNLKSATAAAVVAPAAAPAPAAAGLPPVTGSARNAAAQTAEHANATAASSAVPGAATGGDLNPPGPLEGAQGGDVGLRLGMGPGEPDEAAVQAGAEAADMALADGAAVGPGSGLGQTASTPAADVAVSVPLGVLVAPAVKREPGTELSEFDAETAPGPVVKAEPGLAPAAKAEPHADAAMAEPSSQARLAGDHVGDPVGDLTGTQVGDVELESSGAGVLLGSDDPDVAVVAAAAGQAESLSGQKRRAEKAAGQGLEGAKRVKP